MKKTIKVAMTIAMLITIILSSTMVFASVVDPGTFTGEGSTIETTKLDNFGQSIVKVLSTIGSIASVLVLIVLGIKYMMGSAEEKAEYKKTLIPYVIGAVFVFAASVIASTIFNVAGQAWS